MGQLLRAGAASVVITPPPGIDQGGYGGRAGPATGVHDDLEGAALCVEEVKTGTTAILLTADLVGIDAHTAAEVRKRIAARAAVPAGNIMLTCSHTHAGPAMPCLPTLGACDSDYLDELKTRLTAVALNAWERRAPARISAGAAPVTLSWNRRDGDRNHPDHNRGTIQREVDVLRLDDLEGKVKAVWMCYPAHPVTLRQDNLSYSADWVGAARAELARHFPNATILFAQGCAGNLVSWPHDGSFETVAKQGKTFAAAVGRALAQATPTKTTTVAGHAETIPLHLEDPPSVEDARGLLNECRRERDTKWEHANYGWRQVLAGNVAWAERLVTLAEEGATNLTAPYEVQVVRIGDFAVVGLDGEVFVEYALRLRRESPFSWTAVAGYTNGNIGYVPTAAAFAQGGYEVDTAIRYYGTLRLRPDCESSILTTAGSLLEAAATAGEPLPERTDR